MKLIKRYYGIFPVKNLTSCLLTTIVTPQTFENCSRSSLAVARHSYWGTISLTRITVLCCWLWLIFCVTFHKSTKFPRLPPTFCLYNCTLKSIKTILTLLRFKPVSLFFKTPDTDTLTYEIIWIKINMRENK